MNKNIYKVVFSKIRNAFVVVAEIAIGHSKSSVNEVESVSTFTLNKVSFATMFALGAIFVVPTALAQGVVVAPNVPHGQQPHISQAGNGVPVVNIQTPSAGGVSHNVYNQFNVNQQGLIFNNSHNNVATQLGGYIGGNANLAGARHASVILNEVNSHNPSYLNGYMEIAGSRAELVIANPGGITCSGCGFINANKITLTTGAPQMNNGNLMGFVVGGGNIAIEGLGMDASTADYTALISRSVQVNAGLWANNLNVIAGRNEVSYDLKTVNALTDDDSEAPAFAIDVASLGGMYAGKISLLGTEHGVGVRNAGEIGTSIDDIVVTAAGQVINRGVISSNHDVRIASAEQVRNQGEIKANRSASIQANDLKNEGNIYAVTGSLTASATQGIFNSGELGSALKNTLTSNNGNIYNQGAIFSNNDVQIVSAKQVHNTGEVKANRSASIQANDLKNEGDIFAITGSLTASAAQGISNTGKIGSALDNTLRSSHGNIYNEGTIFSNNDVKIVSTKQVHNKGEVEAKRSASIEANDLKNEGAIFAITGSLTASATQGISNTGKIGSALDNTLRSSHGNIYNQGAIFSNNDVKIVSANQVHNKGAVEAKRNASIEANDFKNEGDIFAITGNLTASAAQGIINDGQLVASLNNTIKSHGSITNTGYIDGGLTYINAGTLHNKGVAAIYGNDVLIQADIIRNEGTTDSANQVTEAPIIAARNNLVIGVNELYNKDHANILAIGNFEIGRNIDLNTWTTSGRASLVENYGAKIEALGNGKIAATTIKNINRDFSTKKVIVSRENITEYQIVGQAFRYKPSQISTFINEVSHLVTPSGTSDNYYMYTYTRTVTEDQVDRTDPGQILTGGNLIIDADLLLNDKSQVLAGGILYADASNIKNIDVNGIRTIADNGYMAEFWRIRKKGKDKQGGSTVGYNPAAVVSSYNLGGPVSGGQTVNPDAFPGQDINLQGSNSLQGGINLLEAGWLNSSLYALNKRPNANYLIETDPRLTNYKKWLSTDYFLSQLQLDPSVTLKRLGDGFFEQQYLRGQINELTGKRFLSGYSSDEDQFLALMDSGIEFSEKMSLTVGVELTAEQMASLTSDIVWMVSETVTLPDGSQVTALVPKIYLAADSTETRLAGNAVIGGNQIQLNVSGTFENQGVLTASNQLNIFADTIQNSGNVQGDNVLLSATGDLNHTGGTILGKNSVLLGAGNDVNIVSQTNETHSATGSRTNLDKVAHVIVTGSDANPNGDLIIVADNDVNIAAAGISNAATDGLTQVIAGKDINIGTVETTYDNAIVRDSNNYSKEQGSWEIGSEITTLNDLNLSAGNDLNVKGSILGSASGNLIGVAGNDINITVGENYEQINHGHQHKDSNSMTSKTTHTTRAEIAESSATSSQLFAGESLILQADNDLNATGSQILAVSDLRLSAENDIHVTAAQTYRTEDAFESHKKKGIFSGSGLSFTIGSKKDTLEKNSNAVNHLASIVGSTEGDVYINAGQSYNQIGSKLSAQLGDVNVTAGDINIISVENSITETVRTTSSQTGLTVGLVGGNVTIKSPFYNVGLKQGEDGRTVNVDGTVGNSSVTVGKIGGTISDLNVTSDPKLNIDSVTNIGTNVQNVATEGVKNLGTDLKNKINETAKEIGNSSKDAARDAAKQIGSDIKNNITGKENNDLTASIKDNVSGAVEGVGTAINNGINGAINDVGNIIDQGIDNTINKIGETVNGAITDAKNGVTNTKNDIISSLTTLPEVKAGVNVTVSLGSSKSQETITTGEIRNQASDISAGGNINLNATNNGGKGNINIIGSTLNAKETINLIANNDVNVISAKDIDFSGKDSSSKNASLGVSIGIGSNTGWTASLGLDKSKGQGSSLNVGNASSNLNAGADLNIQSGNDLNVVGSGLNAGNDANLSAKNDINIIAAENSSLNDSSSSKKSAGLSVGYGTAGWSGSLNLGSDKNKANGSSTGNDASSINVGNNLNVQAGNDLNVIGSGIQTGNDANLIAKNEVNIIAAENSSNNASSSSSKNLGLSVGYGDAGTSVGLNLGSNKKKENGSSTGSDSSSLNIGNNLNVQAGTDLNIVGSDVKVGNDANLIAKNDVNIVGMQNSSSKANSSSGKNIGINVGVDKSSNVNFGANYGNTKSNEGTNNNGWTGSNIEIGNNLNVQSGNNINVAGSDVKADGSVNLSASNDINIQATQKTENTNSSNSGLTVSTSGSVAGKDWSGSLSVETSKGNSNKSEQGWNSSSIQAGTDMSMQAGNNINISGSNVNADNDMKLAAGNDVHITGTQNNSSNESHSSSNKIGTGVTGTGPKWNANINYGQTKNNSDDSTDTWNSSNVTAGNNLDIQAGNNIDVLGSNLGTETGEVNLTAKNDINIVATQNVTSTNRDGSTLDVGFGLGGVANKITSGSLSYGDSKDYGTHEVITWNGSNINAGSNLNMNAGNDINVVGSGLNAKENIGMGAGNNVNLEATQNSTIKHDNVTSNKGGVSISRGGNDEKSTWGGSINYEGSKTISNEESISWNNTTVNAGGGITVQSGQDINLIGSQLKAGEGVDLNATNDINVQATQNLNANDKKGSSVNLNLSGSNHNKSETDVNNGKGKEANALGFNSAHTNAKGNNVTWNSSVIEAGTNVNMQAGNNVSIIGSDVKGGGDVNLAAGNNINMQATQNVSGSFDNSSSFKLGVTDKGTNYGVSTGFTNNKASGNDVSWNNSHVSAGGNLNIQSGKDLNMVGATATGDTTNVNVGGSLNVQSLQDAHDAQNKKLGLNLDFKVKEGGSLGGFKPKSGNYANSDDSYLSVNEQSGIKAGDGGFNVTVGGHTQLNGGVISSNQVAIDNGLNNFETGTIATENIENHAEYGNIGISVPNKKKESSISFGSGNKTSTTEAGVSDGNIIIRDNDAQLALTGQTAEEAKNALNTQVNTEDSSQSQLPTDYKDDTKIEAPSWLQKVL